MLLSLEIDNTNYYKTKLYKMKKIVLIIFVFLTTSFSLFAQQNNDETSSFGRVNLGLHGLDLSYEFLISKKFIWENSIGIGMGSSVYHDAEYRFVFTQPVPYLKSELKYIYNIEKRLSKGKNIVHNSGNYVGIQTKYSFGNSNNYLLNQTLLTEIHWGIQRSIGSKFIFGTHIGLGYIKDFTTNNGEISPVLGFRFGYRLF